MSDINNSMTGEATVIAQTTNDQLGEITVCTKNEQDGEINVIGNRNSVQGTIEIIPPPQSPTTLTPTYDAYTRSDFLSYSFGQSSAMHTGKMNENIDTQSFIYFDLHSHFTNTSILVKSILRLYSISPSQSALIGIYSVDKAWQENSITYSNQPNKKDLITTKTINSGDSYTDIDLTNYFKDAFENNSDNGLCIALIDPNLREKGFYTKEASGSLRPSLNVTYYDTNDLVENADMDGEITVTRNESNDQDGEIAVYATKMTVNDDAIGEITISKPEQLGEISVVKKSDQDGEISVYYKIASDQLSDVSVYTTGENTQPGEINVVDHITTNKDQSGEIQISKPEQLGEITVLSHTEQDGEINIKAQSHSEQSGEITTTASIHDNSNQFGEITVTQKTSDNQSGEIIVVNSKSTNDDVTGEIQISNPEQLGEISVIAHNDQSGDITVGVSSDQSGEINLHTTIYDDQLGEITVCEKSDQSGEIQISKPEQLGDITVLSHTEQDGEITVNNSITINNDQSGEINVSTRIGSDQDGEIIVSTTSDQLGEINLKTQSQSEQSGEINASTRIGNDQSGEITVTNERFKGFTYIIHR